MFEWTTVFAEGENTAAGTMETTATTQQPGDSPQAQSNGFEAVFGMVIPLLLMIAVFYFILIRPQRKKDKALRAMIADLKIGDEVATIGGIHGKIFRIKDDTFILESGAGTNKSYIQIDRSAVSRLVKEADNSKKVTPIPEIEEPAAEEGTEE